MQKKHMTAMQQLIAYIEQIDDVNMPDYMKIAGIYNKAMDLLPIEKFQMIDAFAEQPNVPFEIYYSENFEI